MSRLYSCLPPTTTTTAVLGAALRMRGAGPVAGGRAAVSLLVTVVPSVRVTGPGQRVLGARVSGASCGSQESEETVAGVRLQGGRRVTGRAGRTAGPAVTEAGESEE